MGRPRSAYTRKTAVPRAVEGVTQPIRNTGFTVEESAKLQEFASAVDPPERLQNARHFSLEDNIAQHQLYGCRLWRRGEGQIGADGEWVEAPDVVLRGRQQ